MKCCVLRESSVKTAFRNMLFILLACKETHCISAKALIKLLIQKEIIRPMKKSFINKGFNIVSG